MTDRIDPPRYQKLLRFGGWLLVGVLSAGSVLSALSNASKLISYTIAGILSGLVVALALGVELYIRRRPLLWVLKTGTAIRVRHLGPKFQIGLAGIIGLLWLGAAMHDSLDKGNDPDKDALRLALVDHILSLDEVHEIVYCVSPVVADAAFVGVYLPLQVANLGENKTADEVTIMLRYPKEPHISVTRPVNQDTMGMKERGQIRRRAETFEGFDFVFLSVDALNPGPAALLNEPLELPSELLASPLATAEFSADVTAKNRPMMTYRFKVRCIKARSIDEAEMANRALIWTKAVADRKQSGFFEYWRRGRAIKRAWQTIIVPQFREARDLAGAKGFLSDPMHDKVKNTAYTPFPIQYLLAPLRQKIW